MAHTKSSIKDLKRIKKRTIRNRTLRSKMRTYVKTARVALDKDTSDASERVDAACRVLDMMVTKGIIKKNNASRRKSRLMKRLNITLNIGQPAVLKSEKTIHEEPKVVKPERPELDESTESVDADVMAAAINKAEKEPTEKVPDEKTEPAESEESVSADTTDEQS
ncbi:30S ribosomal protein S20 [bacterium]|nr:30S ribosomal protein S20 [bacterium]